MTQSLNQRLFISPKKKTWAFKGHDPVLSFGKGNNQSAFYDNNNNNIKNCITKTTKQ